MGILSPRVVSPIGAGILNPLRSGFGGSAYTPPTPGVAAHQEDGTTVWHQEDGTTPLTEEE